LKYLILRSRFPARALWFVLLVAMAAGVATVPRQVLAQQATPAAAPAPVSAKQGTSSQDATQSEAETEVTPKSEAEELNVYRHAPVVHTLARMFHLKLETTARIFETINFVIIALLILIPLGRFFPKVMHHRRQALRNRIESARALTEDAKTRLSAVEAKLGKLDEEIAAIRAHVEEDSKQDELRIKSAIEQESSRIVAAAEQEIAVAAAQAQRGLRHFAADLAIEQAAKQMVLTPETDRALIAEFVRDTEKGRQN
jgi:F-type H+-transporting ATPase subunit b